MITGLYKIAESGGLGYLMSCYTKHPDGMDIAADEAGLWAAKLMAAGLFTYAPIVYGHKLSHHLKDTNMSEAERYSHELWMNHCERLWQRSDYGIVLMNKGWGMSEGIAIEISEMTLAEKNVYFLDAQRSKVLRLGELIVEADAQPDHPFHDFVQSASSVTKAKHIEGYHQNAVQALKGRIANAYHAAHAPPEPNEPSLKKLLGKVLQ